MRIFDTVCKPLITLEISFRVKFIRWYRTFMQGFSYMYTIISLFVGKRRN